MRPRGIALITTLYVVFAVLLFALMLASLATFQYQLTRDSVTRDSSLEAAQAGMAQSIYNLSNSSNWGTNKESISTSVAADGSLYQVTFDSTLGQPWSVNNLTGSGTVSGYQGQLVPPYSALVVSAGSTAQGKHVQTVESLLQYAAFPYAIMASNQVSSGGALDVNGSTQLTGALLGQHDGTGNVYASSTSANAISGGDGSIVTGKARTPGNAVFGPGSQVLGGIDSGIDAETVPDVNISQYQTAGLGGVTEVAPGGTLIGPVIGIVHAQGDLNLLAAVLINAYIFVDNNGNLNSSGALIGAGSIFVTGNTNIEGLLNADATSGIAIFSQGDLTISSGLLFQGVLYTHGNLTVQGPINVVGALIAQSDTGAGNISLDSGASVTYVPEYTQFANAWSNRNMKGSAVNGTPCLMNQLFWRQLSP